MNDFIRPFTKEEFNKIFHEAGYPEIARQYCSEILDETFDYALERLNYNFSKKAISELDQLRIKVKEATGWTSKSVRDVAWDYLKEYSHIDEYVHQRGLGRGHEWAKSYCNHLNDPDFISAVRGRDNYMSYLKKVCNITKYNSPMNLKSLNAIPQFFETMDSIVAKESKALFISPLDEKRGAWNYSYKSFRIDVKAGNEWLTNGYFLVYYPGHHTISIGIAGCNRIPVKDIEKNAKNEQFSYSNVPYIDTDWWGYLWYDLSDSALEQMQKAESVEEQEKILTNYLNEVMSSIRMYEQE